MPELNGTANHSSTSTMFDDIESCISSFRQGNFLVVLDSESRENEGDLIIAAQDMTPAKMAFMVRYTSGIICAPLSGQLCKDLELPQMIPAEGNEDPNRTAYTVSIDAAAEGVTTGISARDRSTTCTMLARKGARAEDFRRPGHVFPLRAREGGIRARQGHTEAAVEFCRLAGKKAVGVISEIVEEGSEEDGVAEVQGVDEGAPGMMRRDGCMAFARRCGLKICTIEALKDYVEEKEGRLEEKQVNGHV